LLGLCISGCYSGPDTSRAEKADGGGGDDGGPGNRAPVEEEPEPPFEVSGEEVHLSPFHVRLAALAQVLDVAEDDPVLLPLRQARQQLGDHDYASGVRADLAWSPDRMRTWAKALTPVCDSTVMRGRYPDLVQDPSNLQRVAWGREPNGDDLDAVADIMTDPELDWDTQYRLMCLSILSSLEFVGA
jgi:hypothetical protein